MKYAEIAERYLPWLFIAFIVSQNLSTAFVEGDDASTILYHALGRDIALQKPYSAYHSFFDFLLSFLPANNINLLIYAALALSVLGGLITLWFLDKLTNTHVKGFLLVIFIAVPEWLFMVLYINPSILAMGFYVLAFYLLWLNVKADHTRKYWLLASLAMSIAIALRWSFLIGTFVFIPLFFMKRDFSFYNVKDWWRLVVLRMSWLFLPLSVLGAIILIWISGYEPQQVLEIMLWGQSYMSDKTLNPLVALSNLSAFITPAFVILFLVGIFFTIKEKIWWILMVFVMGGIPFVILGFDTSFKYNLTWLLPVMLILSIGLKKIQVASKPLKVLFYIILVFPWIFGVQVLDTRYTWGPGLEMQLKLNKEYQGVQEGQRLFNPSFKAGLAMPNAEGVRPLYGYGDALLRGRWKKFNLERETERFALAEYVSKNRCLIVADRPVAIMQMPFLQLGYQFNESSIRGNGVWSRKLVHSNKSEIWFIAPGDFTSTKDFVELIKSETTNGEASCAGIYATFPKMTLELQDIYPEIIIESGFTAHF